MLAKRIKLAVSGLLLMAVLGTGLSVVTLPGKAHASDPDCRCKFTGDYYYERIPGGCAWLCQ
jgi:hypothetical protein